MMRISCHILRLNKRSLHILPKRGKNLLDIDIIFRTNLQKLSTHPFSHLLALKGRDLPFSEIAFVTDKDRADLRGMAR